MAAQPLREQLIRKWHDFLPMRGLSAHPGYLLQQQSVSLHPVCVVPASHGSHRPQHCPNSAAPLRGGTSDLLSPNSVFDEALHEGRCKQRREPKQEFLHHQRHTNEGRTPAKPMPVRRVQRDRVKARVCVLARFTAVSGRLRCVLPTGVRT